MKNTTSIIAENVRAALDASLDLDSDLAAIAELLTTDPRHPTNAADASRHLRGVYSFSFPQLQAVAEYAAVRAWDLFEGLDCFEDSPATRKRWSKEQSDAARELTESREQAGLTRRELSFRAAVAAGEVRGRQVVPERIRALEHIREPGRGEVTIRELIPLCRLGDVGPSPELITDAIARAHRERCEGIAKELRNEGLGLGRMIWNAAEDRDFVDQIIAMEMSSLRSLEPEPLRGATVFKLRVAILEIADQLRIAFPDRPQAEPVAQAH